MPAVSLVRILATLREHDCQFVLVGGLAAVLHGTPIQTYDVDLVYSRAPDNLPKMAAALEELDAIFRMQPDRRLRPNFSHLSGSGHLNLLTSAGPLDLLATVGVRPLLSYDDLLPFTQVMHITDDVQIAVLQLEKLIELKEELGGEKDRAVLPSLYQTLRLKKFS